jgi:hypothetical protein
VPMPSVMVSHRTAGGVPTLSVPGRKVHRPADSQVHDVRFDNIVGERDGLSPQPLSGVGLADSRHGSSALGRRQVQAERAERLDRPEEALQT